MNDPAKHLVIAFAISSLITACATSPEVIQSTAADIENQTWVLKTIKGQKPAEKTRITLSMKNDSGLIGLVSGRGPCNSYFGSYYLNNGSIKFSRMASTKKACPQPLMEQEMVFFDLFEEVGQVTVSQSSHSLTLKSSQNNGALMSFIAETSHITGKIYTSEGGFAANSRLIITLKEIRQDQPSLLLGEQEILFDKAQVPPTDFDLVYAPHLLQEDGIYSISAVVKNALGGKAFASTGAIEADFENPMKITLEPADH